MLVSPFLFLALALTLLPDQVSAHESVASQPHLAPSVLTLTTGAVGDPLARIQCGTGYSATIFADNLSGPDGLAFSPGGILHVAEETSGEISQIGPSGLFTNAFVSGLNNPEGITFDDVGNLFIVEDIRGGRVVSATTNGVTGVVATGLDSPEGIVWVAGDNQLYVTEQNLEYALSTSSTTASDYRTHVTSVSMAGSKTRILTTTAIVTPGFSIDATFWSYAGITLGSDGSLYFTNELSGQEINTTVMGFPFHADSSGSVFQANRTPIPSTALEFANDQLLAAEGLRFSNSGGFPLYVVEEDTGSGAGRLSRVQSNGTHTTFCTGFESIEDVAIDQSGNFYVSEDTTGYIIKIEFTSTFSNNVYLPVILRQS